MTFANEDNKAKLPMDCCFGHRRCCEIQTDSKAHKLDIDVRAIKLGNYLGMQMSTITTSATGIAATSATPR